MGSQYCCHPAALQIQTKGGTGATWTFLPLTIERPWDFPELGEITSCSIITTVPNSLMEPIHDRMPVILPRELYEDWLNPENQDVGDLK